MNFSELINKRQSVRKYSDKQIDIEDIKKCVEAARLSPSANNSQPWKFVIVNDKQKIGELGKAANTAGLINKFVETADAIAVIVLEKPNLITKISTRIKKKEWQLIDIGIAAEHFCLQATELGIGTCIIGWYKEDSVRKILSIPKTKTVALMISLGYPVDGHPQRQKQRKAFEDIYCENIYK